VTAPRYAWGARSLGRLQTCHPLLVTLMQRVIARADLPSDMTIVYGQRTMEEQAALYAKGRTVPGEIVTYKRPGESKHNTSPSEAIDVAPFIARGIPWADVDAFEALHAPILAEWVAMVEEGLVPYGVRLNWGGHWRIRDLAHWELAGLENVKRPPPLAAARAGAR